MRKIVYVTILVVVLLVGFLGITYSYEYNTNSFVQFELLGDSTINIDVGSKYIEYGVNVYRDGIDISSSVKIDSSFLNTNKVGEYKVKYEIEVDGNIEYIYRIVNVVDRIEPVIKLKGEDTVNLELGDSYIEEGYIISDNYDKLSDIEIEIIDNINISKVGEYRVEYRATDSSGNVSIVTRNVIVQ